MVKFPMEDRERGRRIREGHEKYVIFIRISETVQDRTKVTIND